MVSKENLILQVKVKICFNERKHLHKNLTKHELKLKIPLIILNQAVKLIPATSQMYCAG